MKLSNIKSGNVVSIFISKDIKQTFICLQSYIDLETGVVALYPINRVFKLHNRKCKILTTYDNYSEIDTGSILEIPFHEVDLEIVNPGTIILIESKKFILLSRNDSIIHIAALGPLNLIPVNTYSVLLSDNFSNYRPKISKVVQCPNCSSDTVETIQDDMYHCKICNLSINLIFGELCQTS